MFDNLRHAFKEALENFNKELSREQMPGTVDRLLSGMRDEVADAKVRVRELEDHLARTTAEAEREKTEVATARRRGKMAADIGDEETARVAMEYAARHEERHAVLEKSALAMKDELALRAREIEEMLAKVKEAQAQRDGLTATTGRSGARESLSEADDLFSELDRMAEKIGGEDARAQAAQDFADLDLAPGLEEPVFRAPEIDMDEALAELKRRMGRD
jgi:phage shock protein A